MNCPCGSGKKYSNCCKKYHDGAQPENALKLMKARYSAYAKNQLKFLFDTLYTPPSSYEEFLRGIRQDARYQRLIIRDFQDGETTATVTFTAFITLNNHDATFTERSTFEKVNGRWLYKSGVVAPGSLA